jgi:D-alanyl-D-alanine carboxypeptidase
MRRFALVVALAAIACSSGGRATSERAPTSSTGTAEPAPTTTPPTTAAPAPVFESAVAPIDDGTRARMPHSWRPGCPVPLDALRLVTLDHWGYDGAEHRGELAVHADHAGGLVDVFRVLFDARFPIERMQLVDVYGGDDFASTADNNTAAFNCRSVVGRPGAWSEHAYARAIDVNPLVNPYLGDPRVNDPRLAPYLDRSTSAPGMIRPGDVVVTAFAAAGWKWGGTWPTPDYQHFSATGR